jgi:hypothetical protein
MYKHIIVASCLFGSVHICSISLILINNSFLFSKNINRNLIILNGLIFVISGSIFIYSVNLLK